MPGISNDDLKDGVLRRFNEVREGQRIPGADLAGVLKIGASTVSGWTDGTHMISTIYLAALPTAFRKLGKETPSLHYLLTEEGPMYMAIEHNEQYKLGVMHAVTNFHTQVKGWMIAEVERAVAKQPVATKDVAELDRTAAERGPKPKRRAAHRGRRGAT